MTRSLKELYQILLKHLKGLKEYFYICSQIATIHWKGLITKEEMILLTLDFESKRPNKDKYVEFYNNKSFVKNTFSNYWWDCLDKESVKQKILFVQHLIDELP